jgi:hypothetical protein
VNGHGVEPQIPRSLDPLPDLSRDEHNQLVELARLVVAGTVQSLAVERNADGALLITAFPKPIVYHCRK